MHHFCLVRYGIVRAQDTQQAHNIFYIIARSLFIKEEKLSKEMEKLLQQKNNHDGEWLTIESANEYYKRACEIRNSQEKIQKNYENYEQSFKKDMD